MNDDDAQKREIKERALEVIQSYVSLKQVSSTNWRASCPFHGGKNPTSFSVWYTNGDYVIKCHAQEGCVKGDVFEFVARMEGHHDLKTQFREVMKAAGDRCGVKVVDKKAKADPLKPLYDVEERRCCFFEASIRDPSLKYIYRMLYARGVTRSDIVKHRIGLGGTGFFGGRITFPYIYRGKVLGFTGRTIYKDSPVKWLNSTDSGIFPKSDILWGVDYADEYIRRTKIAVITEGCFDFYAYRRIGVGSVSPVTNKMSEGHVRFLHDKYGAKLTVVMSFDVDERGIAGTIASVNLLWKYGIYDVSVVRYPNGIKDPGEFYEKYRKKGLRMLKKSFQNRVRFTEWFCERAFRDCKGVEDCMVALKDLQELLIEHRKNETLIAMFLTDIANQCPLLPNGEEGARMVLGAISV